jgi:UDP-2,3-diacylglucosamine pyrophosphatase LpxH
MFRDLEQGHRFAELCTGVARGPDNELVLLGDIFDLTAAHPPHKGLTAFGLALDVPIEDKPPRPLPSIMRSIRESNPVALDALESLSAVARVTLVPGNHDRHLAEAGGREALDAAGLPRAPSNPRRCAACLTSGWCCSTGTPGIRRAPPRPAAARP